MQADAIKTLLCQQLPDAEITIEGADGQHFAATVVCSAFAGKSRLQQQQMVYAILGAYITSGELHALALKTYTPAEYHQRHNAK